MSIELTQTQKLGVSQKMIESSEILQMTAVQLQQYLENLSVENPLLDLETDHTEAAKKLEWLNAQDEQNRIYERQERKDREDLWNSNAGSWETLTDSLLFQLSAQKLPAEDYQILEYMIMNLNNHGYLEMSLEDIADQLGQPQEKVETLLCLLQSLEPEGIGARSLQECICIQLERMYPDDKTARLIALSHLDLLGKNQLPAIAKKLKLPLEKVLLSCDHIRRLNPRPGAAFGDRQYMSYVTPDVLVVRFAGYFDVLINDSMCPPIRLNEYYLDLMETCDSPETVAYLEEKKRQIDWISSCISKRNATLLALIHTIIEAQPEFFRKGPGYLKPFSQAMAAQKMMVHESTVSRALRDKYLQCSFGVFPLNYFFVQGMEQKDLIKVKIKELIQQENKKAPLSDGALAGKLLEEDIRISKRMVGKYRNALNIPDAASRKVFS